MLTGAVKDPSGASIPNAQVVVTDVATGVSRTVSADGAGLYSAPNLLPGTYEIRVTATGFTTEVQKGVTLTVGAQQVLDFTMRVGQMSQTVEVTTDAPTVELTSSTLSAQVNAATVRELPLNGRSWTDLANLQPGVAGIETQANFAQGADRGNRGFGAQVTISVARPQQNNYRMDGVSVNDYSNGPPGSVMGGTLGVDAIQEFSVLTSNFSAEYGKSSGGVINAISRSERIRFTAPRMNSCATALWMPETFSTAPLFRHSSAINSAFRPAVQSARTGLSSSATMRAYAKRRASPMSTPYLPWMRAAESLHTRTQRTRIRPTASQS